MRNGLRGAIVVAQCVRYNLYGETYVVQPTWCNRCCQSNVGNLGVVNAITCAITSPTHPQRGLQNPCGGDLR
eukprot:2298666-Pyramimonas_sp.AAC.1